MKKTSLTRPILNMGATLAFLSVPFVLPAPLPAHAADAAQAVPAAQPTALPDGALLVKKGDTLERIISRRLASMPFKQDVLRKALVDKNPGAFTDANKRKLKVGAILQLPTLEDFHHLLAQPAPAVSMPMGTPNFPQPGPPPSQEQPAPAQPAPAQPEAQPAPAQPEAQPAPAQPEAEEDPKRGWVRYP